jgi:transcription initiation factor TFIIE subunit alpha
MRLWFALKQVRAMRITDKKTEDVISQVIGEDAIKIVEYLKDKKDVSEFLMASNLKQDIQVIRNVLYRLHTYNLVTYKRRKDRKKGWYISYWTFSKNRVKELIDGVKKEKLEHFRQRLEDEKANINNFYICPKACSRMDFQSAAEINFKCPECGSVMEQQNNARTIDFLKEKIREIESEAAA